MNNVTQCNGILRLCCADESKRVEVKRESMGAGLERVTEECRTCGRRHFTLTVPPIQVGVAGAGM